MSQYQHFPKLFDSKTNFHVTLLKNGFSPDRLMLPKKPSKPTILPTKPIKMEPEIQIQEGSEPLKFPDEYLPEDGAKKAKIEIGSKEVVVHKDFNELKKKVTPQPHIEIIDSSSSLVREINLDPNDIVITKEDDYDEALEYVPEMLNPFIVEAGHVFKNPIMENFYELKVQRNIMIKLAPEAIEDQYILVALYHSHPEYAKEMIYNTNTQMLATPNQTAFTLISTLGSAEPHYTNVQVPEMQMKFKAAITRLKNSNCLNMKFVVVSTDKQNFGDKKEGKEWHLLILPLTPFKAEELKCSADPKLNLTDLVPHSAIRLQVREEIRKNSRLAKDHRCIEVKFPIVKSRKRKRMEEQYLMLIKQRIQRMGNLELEQHLARTCQFDIK